MTNKKLISTLLITTGILIVFSSILPLKAQTFFASSSQKRQSESIELPDHFTGPLFFLQRKKEPGGGRGPICPIAPKTWVDSNNENAALEPVKVVSSQPLFFWKSNGENATKIEVFEESEIIKDPIWKADIPNGKTHILYQGEPLKPGKVYYWRLTAIGPKKQTYFQVIPEQNRIQEELKKLENQLQSQGASVEEISLEKAHYLAKQGWWSDALREIFSVANPSVELKQSIQQVLAHNFCED
ncbi:hypothetical protein VB834_20295 [Limnoraphis robusta Tam1]|uniref:hypothetical protein n=1 Tax=Limnoraphis robusta TaxID=1118279 RepID=UPI002B2069C9|nr:hypothetical protein [Limnoraphis robusta]MEA5500564.1 hypothetical protein [Limnoraphis robusta BA-68 BA1]MEA5541371.1 hypothetical protein [Limnoraphis robusta Tam1]